MSPDQSESPSPSTIASNTDTHTTPIFPLPKNTTHSDTHLCSIENKGDVDPSNSPDHQKDSKHVDQTRVSNPPSIQNPSPTAPSIDGTRSQSQTKEQAKRKLAMEQEKSLILAPKELKTSPATIPQRLSYLKTIHKSLCVKNHRLPKHAAISLEYKAASSSNTTTYPMAIRSLVRDIKNDMYTGKKSQPQASKPKPSNKDPTYRRLLHPELEKLVLTKQELRKTGYVLDKPKATAVDPSRIFLCDRCGFECSVGSATATLCRYHPKRRAYDIAKRKRDEYYPCCGRHFKMGFAGCETRNSHVFKFDDADIMEGFIPFRHLSQELSTQVFAVGIDCEMGYTTYGVELIRVTVVDWDTLKIVVDEIVKPYGKVLDFNTVFSGISSVENGITFKQAIERVTKYVGPRTIIIGHSLYNDLNALRLLHERCIDTACIYPQRMPEKPRALKTLAFQYLGRQIQSGEHDSAEDAIAAMDVIYANLKAV